MSESNGSREFHRKIGSFARRQGPFRQSVGQTRPLNKPHREERLPLVLTDLEDGHDTGMIKVGSRLCLRAKSLDILFTRVLSRQDHFQCDDAVEADLPGLVNHAHSATGDFFEQFVVAEVAYVGARLWSFPAGRSVAARRQRCILHCRMREISLMRIHGYSGLVKCGRTSRLDLQRRIDFATVCVRPLFLL